MSTTRIGKVPVPLLYSGNQQPEKRHRYLLALSDSVWWIKLWLVQVLVGGVHAKNCGRGRRKWKACKHIPSPRPFLGTDRR
jgi:hypothetical protein